MKNKPIEKNKINKSPLEDLVKVTGDYIKAFDLIKGNAKEMQTYIKFIYGPSLTYFYKDLSK